MKKKFAPLALSMALLLAPASALSVEIDGKPLQSNPGPMMSSGRVLVPMRAVFQALGAKVDYQRGVITATRGNKVMNLRPNSNTAVLNGQQLSLDSPALLKAGTTYVPLRFVAQSLGESVAWQAATRTVVIGEQTAPLNTQTASHPAGPQLSNSLKQLVVGNQGGVLKVLSRDQSETLYFRGIDDRSVAPLSAQDRQQIFGALRVGGNLDAVAAQVMSNFNSLPQKQSLAFLGVLNSVQEGNVSPQTAQQIRSFLANRMSNDRSVYNRRQAVLALAVGSQVEPEIVSEVTRFYRQSDNLWETFPVQQFFEYQAPRLKRMPSYPRIRSEVLSVNSLYRANIASYL